MRAKAGAPGSRNGPAASGPVFVLALASERRALERGAGRGELDAFRIVQSGPGGAAAGTAAADAVGQGGGALISWGIAGGLDEGVRPGSVILPPRIVAEDGAVIATDARWRARLKSMLPVGLAVLERDLAGVAHVLTRPADKARVAASLDAAAADMESMAIGEAADSAGVPFLAIRVVADSAADSLPEDVERFVRPNGEIDRMYACTSIVRRPENLRLLMRLGRCSRIAHRVLEELARSLAGRHFGFGQHPDSAAGAAL